MNRLLSIASIILFVLVSLRAQRFQDVDHYKKTYLLANQETDSSTAWEKTGLTDARVLSLICNHSGHIFAGAYQGGIYRSTNNGKDWDTINNGISNLLVWALAISPNQAIFAGPLGSVFRSTDNGDSWVTVNSGFPYSIILSLACNSKNYVFAGTYYHGLGRSMDNGDHWSGLTNGLTSTDVYSLAIDSSNNIYAGTDEYIFRSSDDGNSWIELSNGLTQPVIRSLAVSPNGSIFAGTGANGIHRSTNGGNNWSQVGLSGMFVGSIAINSQGHIFAGTFSDGVFKSTDNGQTWNDFSSGLTTRRVDALVIDGAGFIYAGSYEGGVFKSLEITTSVKDLKSNHLLSFALYQNYPNPFNPITLISFTLPSASVVSLNIFDILGREVATVVSEKLSAGSYSRQWNAANMPSGIYFCRLQAGSLTQTKKLILMK